MYGCYNPKHAGEYTYHCEHCGAVVTPASGYRTTHGVSAIIFFCPVCKGLEFAYRVNFQEQYKTPRPACAA